jgi:hypothetical protein
VLLDFGGERIAPVKIIITLVILISFGGHHNHPSTRKARSICAVAILISAIGPTRDPSSWLRRTPPIELQLQTHAKVRRSTGAVYPSVRSTQRQSLCGDRDLCKRETGTFEPASPLSRGISMVTMSANLETMMCYVGHTCTKCLTKSLPSSRPY